MEVETWRTISTKQKSVQLPWLNFQLTSPRWIRIFIDIHMLWNELPVYFNLSLLVTLLQKLELGYSYCTWPGLWNNVQSQFQNCWPVWVPDTGRNARFPSLKLAWEAFQCTPSILFHWWKCVFLMIHRSHFRMICSKQTDLVCSEKLLEKAVTVTF